MKTICPKSGKIRHRNRKDAKRHQRSVFARRGDVVHPYECDHCGAWHVGRNRFK